MQVISSGWMEWSKNDVVKGLDFAQLEKLFHKDEKERKQPGGRH